LASSNPVFRATWTTWPPQRGTSTSQIPGCTSACTSSRPPATGLASFFFFLLLVLLPFAPSHLPFSFYFRIGELDLTLITKIHQRVNLIPVVSKADSFTPEEVGKCKKMVSPPCPSSAFDLFPNSFVFFLDYGLCPGAQPAGLPTVPRPCYQGGWLPLHSDRERGLVPGG